MYRIVVLLLAVCLSTCLQSCRRERLQGAMLSAADQKAVLAFSEAETDNLMEGMNRGDYGVFSKDFDDAMLEAFPQKTFASWKQERDTKLGWYLRREVEGMVKRNDGTYTVIYQAFFAYNDDVLMRVVFRADPPHQISGLFFNK